MVVVEKLKEINTDCPRKCDPVIFNKLRSHHPNVSMAADNVDQSDPIDQSQLVVHEPAIHFARARER